MPPDPAYLAQLEAQGATLTDTEIALVEEWLGWHPRPRRRTIAFTLLASVALWAVALLVAWVIVRVVV